MSKTNIIELFTFLNPNYRILEENEVGIVSIAFNMNFGNLRFGFYEFNERGLYNNVIFINSMKLLTDGTIYPSSAYAARQLDIEESAMTCMEQLVTDTGDSWQRERPIVMIEKIRNGKRITIKNSKKNTHWSYDFIGLQLDMLHKSLEYTYNNGFLLRGINTLGVI